MSSNRVESFVGAQNFCTGSQTDYATCITNNMRFLPFTDDTYKPSSYAGINISNSELSALSGKTYVDAKPLAIANIYVRKMMKNDYGVISFRCKDVYSQPRLPLPRLQDLGLESYEIVNIVDVIPEPEEDQDLFYGVPLLNEDDCLGDYNCLLNVYLTNSINLSIGLSRSLGLVVNSGDSIQSIINNMGNYYQLPAEANILGDNILISEAIATKLLEELQKLSLIINPSHDYFVIMNNMTIIADSLVRLIQNQDIGIDLYDNVVQPLVDSIDEHTDFAYYDFSITDGVSEYLKTYDYNFLFGISYQEKLVIQSFGSTPKIDYTEENYNYLLISIENKYAMEIYNATNNIILKIQELYNYSNVSQITTATEINLRLYNEMIVYKDYFTVNLLNKFNDPKYNDVILALINLIDNFTVQYSGGTNIIHRVATLYNPTDPEAKERVISELDKYFSEVGDNYKILLAQFWDIYSLAFSLDSSKVTTQEFGLNFKDSGDFYFADVAYSLAYSRIVGLKGLIIDDEVYDLSDITTLGGNITPEVSQAGCVKYTFTRHIMPTYSPTIEMYLYPGTPDQPYCPTVNKYHNYNACSYSGIFTKLLEPIDQNGDANIGLYVFKNYRPLEKTVEEVTRIGKFNINSINLNDPSLDDKSYEAMVQKEILNLTNASSIINSTITTDDFKYYLSSKIVDEVAVNNYPNLALVEFKKFPIGSSLSLPKIKLLVEADDPALKV